MRNMDIPIILESMADALKKENINLSVMNSDGRINSSTDETIIIDALRKLGFGEDVFIVPHDRKWYDLWLVVEDMPVNIKSTDLGKNVGINTCNFLAILWSLTSCKVEKTRSANKRNDYRDLMEYFEREVIDDVLENNRDYCFFVVNKKNTTDIVVNTLKGLAEYTPNVNNLPFQVKFNKNRTFVNKALDTARKDVFAVLDEAFCKGRYQRDFENFVAKMTFE